MGGHGAGLIAGKIAKVGEMEWIPTLGNNNNPQEEFLANYSAAMASLPLYEVKENFYYDAVISSLNQLLRGGDNTSRANKYAAKIQQLFNLVLARIKLRRMT